MQLPSVFCLAIVILIFTEQVKSDCQLTKAQVENEIRIFALKTNGVLHLLRRDKVTMGTTLHMICTATDVITTVCQADGTFKPELPIQNCQSPIKASPELIQDDGGCAHQTYRVGYKVNRNFLEVYRVCYNKTGVSAKYTQHNAYAYSIVTSRPETSFSTDYIVSGANATTFKASSIYNRFEAVLGPKQKYIKTGRDLVFARGHLTPSADFVFVNNMKSTFKIVNVVPMFSSINGGNWRSIESWVRRLLNTVGVVQVYTGVLGILSLKDDAGKMVPMYLGANNINPIPEWIYKDVVLRRNGQEERIVFVTYNNIYEPTMPAAICQTVACPMQLNNLKESGFTYCCDPNDFQRLVPYRLRA